MPSTAATVSCPNCLQALPLPNHLAGKKVRCPKCQQSFTANGDGGNLDAVAAASSVPALPAPTAGLSPAAVSVIIMVVRLGIWFAVILIAAVTWGGLPEMTGAADSEIRESFPRIPYRAMRLVCAFMICLALDHMAVAVDNWFRDSHRR